MMFPVPVLCFLLVLLGAEHQAHALNFEVLDTPVLDFVSNAMGGNDNAQVQEDIQRAQTGEEGGVTLAQLLFGAACDTGGIPDGLCGYFGENTPRTDTAEANALQDFNTGNAEEEKAIVDGLLLGFLCGVGGRAPTAACNIVVGSDGNSGLIRTFCESGIVPQGFCSSVRAGKDEAGARNEDSQTQNGGGRKKALRG
ncbi:expressed unknown protein [Seminavis robusta]|uniref:Uncharacterized protein n=1 Tax=Seminavis robusta TaxID=568900 RepID=A0A9N8ECC2_9STRA|nr:expressed unknown protein [Seminavis robusta]|eukprot:Sro965_g225570.1 n/a (197) ;mRNA; f:15234-15824